MSNIGVDLSLGPIEVMAGIQASLNRMNDRFDREEKRRDTLRARVPADVRLVTSGACPSGGGDFVLTIGGPDPGFYWILRRLILGGLLFDTAANGDGEVYVTGLQFNAGGASTNQVGSLALSDLVDHAATFPNIAFYSPHQIIIQAQENLAVLIGGGTGNQTYVMAAQLQVYRTITATADFEI